MGRNKLKLIASAIVLAGSGLSLILYYWVTPPFDSRSHEAMGQVAAEETLRLLGSGGRISVILRDTVTAKNPATEAQLRSLVASLQAHHLKVTSTNAMKVDPLRVPSVPPGDFLQILKRGAEGDVIVSFLGPPNLTEQQTVKLEAKGPKVIALCSGAISRQVDLRSLFQRNLLSVAIVNRAVPASRPAGGTPRAVFDRYYQVLTSANLAEWADAKTTH